MVDLRLSNDGRAAAGGEERDELVLLPYVLLRPMYQEVLLYTLHFTPLSVGMAVGRFYHNVWYLVPTKGRYYSRYRRHSQS
jgi:hypothetical protein